MNGKIFLGFIAGLIVACMLCFCAMLLGVLVIVQDPKFKESYCEALIEEGFSLSEEPFGLCK